MCFPTGFAQAWQRSQVRIHRGGPIDWTKHTDRPHHPHPPMDFWSLNLVRTGCVGLVHNRGPATVAGPGVFLVPPRTPWRSRLVQGPIHQTQALISIQPEPGQRHPLLGFDEVICLPYPKPAIADHFIHSAEASAWQSGIEQRLPLAPASESLLLDCLAQAQAGGIIDLGRQQAARTDLIPALTSLIALHCKQHDFGIDDLLRASGLSRSRLDTVFRHSTGLTPVQYLRRERLLLGARLLRDGNVGSIAEAAGRCGFSTQALFTRHFRRHFGLTPGAWRRGERPGQQRIPAY